jgi:ankyrin repeat protein
MSSFTVGQKPGVPSSNFNSILEAALSDYKEKNGSGVLEHPLAEDVKRCDSIGAISAILQGQAREFQSFPSAGAVFTEIGAFLSAGKDGRASHDALIELLFGRIESFFKRLGVYPQVSLATELGEVIVNIVTEVLSILLIATKEVKRNRAKIYFRKLFGRGLRTDVEDALKKLDSLLTRAEVRMAVTQTSKATDLGDIFGPESSWDETFRLWMEECGVDGNVHEMYETILLHSASYQGTPEMVTTLLNRGLKLNAKNPWGETVLHSVSRGRQGSQCGVRVAKLLLERGVDVNARRKDHQMPLHVASYYGNLEIVRLLLDHGADIEAAWGDMGEKPLHQVTYGKYRSQDDGVRVAQLLLDRGADVNTRRKDHWTPLHHASHFGNVEIVRLFLDHGADHEAAGYKEQTPLHHVSYAEYRSQEDGIRVAKLLLDRGAEVNTQRKDDWTPLHHASYFGNVEFVRLLLEHGADVKAVDNLGKTPLHDVSRGRYESQEDGLRVARLLLAHGANIDAEATSGHTPLDLAYRKKRPKLSELFLKHAANVNEPVLSANSNQAGH